MIRCFDKSGIVHKIGVQPRLVGIFDIDKKRCHHFDIDVGAYFAMHDAVARLIPNYSDGKRYKVDGQFFADEKAICFLMTDAEVKMFRKE